MSVRKSQYVYIRHNLASGASWQETINLSFEPNRMILRQIAYNGATPESIVAAIHTSLTNNYIGLLTGTAGNHVLPNHIFALNTPVRGNTFEFRVDGAQGSLTAGANILGLFIEFQVFE